MRKELIVIQQDLKDCGICCLLSIIKHYHGYVPLENLRIDTSTSLEGTNAYQLIKTAQKYGFDAVGKKIENLDNLGNDIILPCIAHINFDNYNHFIVIYQNLKDKLLVMDPAKGKVFLKKEKFLNIWTKVIIEMYPKQKIVYIKPYNYLKKISSNIFKNNHFTMLKILLSKILVIILSIILGFHFKLTSILYENNLFNFFLLFSILFLFGYILKVVFAHLENKHKNILNKNIDALVYHDFLERLFLLPDSFVKNRTTGEIMARVEELGSIKEFYSNMILSFLLEAILVLAVLIVLAFLNKVLFLILCLFLLFYLIIGLFFSKRLFNKIINNIEVNSIFNAKIIEDLDTFSTIKNLGVTEKINLELKNITDKYLDNNFTLNSYLIKLETITNAFEQLLYFTICIFGYYFIFTRILEIVDIYTFLVLINYPINFVRNLIITIPKYNYIKASTYKIRDYFDIPIEKEEKANQFSYGDIKINNLNYSINPQNQIFNNLNLLIPKKSHILLKGPSGCGKSTLCQLIAGLKSHEDSSIYISNIEISKINNKSLRQNVTYIGQKENLIQDTIKNNIIFFRQPTDDYLTKIINICHINEIVSQKPLGYETFLFKDSLNLSGGEKQRIILARALLNNFKILILDEALSEVNEDLEIDIIKNLQKLFYDRTIIYVSHKNHEQYFDFTINLNKQRNKGG